MSWEFVVSIIFAIITLIVSLGYRNAKRNLAELNKLDQVGKQELANVKDSISVTKTVFIACLILTGIFVFFASAYTVPVRNIGIVTAFNRPTGDTTGSGLKFVWPWQDVEDFDASVQTTNHLGKWNEGCTVVRIGSLAQACVENRIQWQVSEEFGPKVFNDYKGDFENVRNNLVESKIQNALNEVFATYNPLSQVNLQTGQTVFDGAKLGKDLEAKLKQQFGNEIKVVFVSVPLIHHDAQTEANIKQFQDVVAQARILEQKEKNAVKEKLVSDLQRQFLTQEYLQNKCIEESVKLGYAPGLCLMDSGIVNAPTAKP